MWLTNEIPREALKDPEFVATFKRLIESMSAVGFAKHDWTFSLN